MTHLKRLLLGLVLLPGLLTVISCPGKVSSEDEYGIDPSGKTETVTIYIKYADDKVHDSLVVEKGSEYWRYNLPVPYLEDYDFAGWYTDIDFYWSLDSKGYPLYSDLIIYAKFNSSSYCNVSIMSINPLSPSIEVSCSGYGWQISLVQSEILDSVTSGFLWKLDGSILADCTSSFNLNVLEMAAGIYDLTVYYSINDIPYSSSYQLVITKE